MASIQQIITDPDFLASGVEVKRRILASNDKDFAESSREVQDQILRSYASEFRNPPTLSEQIIGGFRRASEEILPAIGLIGGSALGAAAGALSTGPLAPLGGTGGAVVGAGLGFAVGREANRVIGDVYRQVTGQTEPKFPQVAPPERPGHIGQIAQDVVVGGALQAAPPAVIEAAKKLGVPIKALLGVARPTGEDLAVRAAARRANIPLPASAASGSTPVALIESIPARFPLGRQTVEPTVQRIQVASQKAAEGLGQELGPSKALEQAGKTIQREIESIARAQQNAPTELVNRFLDDLGASPMGKLAFGGSLKEAGATVEQMRRAKASALYKRALDLGGPESEVPLRSTQAVSTRMVKAEQRLTGVQTPIVPRAGGLQQASAPPNIQPGALPDEALIELLRTGTSATRQAVQSGTPISVQNLPQEFIERYGLTTYGSRTLEETISIQQRLRSLMRNSSDDFTRRQLKQLLDAVTDDVKQFGTSVGGEFGQALQAASKHYREEVAALFTRKAPLRKLFNKDPGLVAEQVLSTKSPDLLTALMRSLPERQQTELQRLVLDRMKQRALDVRTGEINPQQFQSELVRFGEENLQIVLGREKLRGLDRVRTTLQKNFGAETTEGVLDYVLTAHPERIVNTLARGKIKSLADFEAVWNQLSPVAKQETRSSLYQEVLLNSVDDRTGRFSIERFLTQKEKVPQEIWDRMLTGNTIASLRDLELVFRRIAKFSQVAANPSQTSGAILGPSQVLGAAALAASTAIGREDVESFSLKTFGILSPVALGALVFSRPGQRFLTSRVPSRIDPQGTMATALKLLGAHQAQSPRPRNQNPEPVNQQ